MKKLICFMLFFILFFVGCVSASKDEMPSGDYFSETGIKKESSITSAIIGDKTLNILDDIQVMRSATKQPGQLTASVVFDNNDYNYWKELITSNQEGNGLFKSYSEKYSFNTMYRKHIKIEGAKNAKVLVLEDGFVTYTDANGNAYLFLKADLEEFTVKITYYDSNNEQKILQTKVKDKEIIDLNDKGTRRDRIELMFVVDTTGSMGDELAFLKAEIDDVINSVQKQNPNSSIYLSLLFYRDKGDEYLVKYSDFTKDIEKQREVLSMQEPSGGGDFPEAVYAALDEAQSKQWSEDSSTRILVMVADAPSHDDEIEKWEKNVKKLSQKGVKIITVASSGIDKKTEYFFRSQSMITGGAYVYLTDDSGIGNSHLEATTKEKPVVEYLNKLLIRLIHGYHNGDFGEAVPYDGYVKPGVMPENMPSDFDIEIRYGEALGNSFKLSEGTHTVVPNETYKIEFTDKELIEIYNTINSCDFDEVRSENKEGFDYGIYFKITYDGKTQEVYYCPPEDYILTKTDKCFYEMFVKILNAIVSKH